MATFDHSSSKSGFNRTASLLAAFSLTLACTAPAADWPQWRGNNRDGISTEKGWKTSWPTGGPAALWKLNLGPACSSFAVVGEHVYTMGNQKDTDSVYCLDAKTGKTVWQHSYPAPLEPTMFEGGPCSTPTVNGENVYTIGRHGQLFCLNKDTGTVVWTKDLLKEFSAKPIKWGYSGSLLVLGDKVLIDAGAPGASAVAFDKTTGKLLWKAGDDIASYSSPIGFQNGGKECVAFFNAAGLVIRDAADGKELSRFPWKTSYDVNPTTPIVSGDKVFIASGYGHGGALLQLSASGVTKVWESKSIKNKMNSSVLWEGNLYGFDESKLTCLDFATGAVKWQQDKLGAGSLILADGKLIVQAEDGNLVIAEASPAAYKELARTQAVPKRSWVIPVLANGRIFCRNNSGDVTCIDVKGE